MSAALEDTQAIKRLDQDSTVQFDTHAQDPAVRPLAVHIAFVEGPPLRSQRYMGTSVRREPRTRTVVDRRVKEALFASGRVDAQLRTTKPVGEIDSVNAVDEHCTTTRQVASPATDFQFDCTTVDGYFVQSTEVATGD